MNSRFDLDQPARSPVRDASDQPAARRDGRVSAAFPLEGGPSCYIEFSSLRQPHLRCSSPAFPTMPLPAAAGEAFAALEFTGVARSVCAADTWLAVIGAPTVQEPIVAIALVPTAATATGAIVATARRRLAPPRLAPLPRGPTT